MLYRFIGWRQRWLYVTNNHLFTGGEFLSATPERWTQIPKILRPSVHLFSPHHWLLTSCSCHQANVGLRTLQHVIEAGQWESWPFWWILPVLLKGVSVPVAITLFSYPAETARHAVAYGWEGEEEEYEDGSRDELYKIWRQMEEKSKRKNKSVIMDTGRAAGKGQVCS